MADWRETQAGAVSKKNDMENIGISIDPALLTSLGLDDYYDGNLIVLKTVRGTSSRRDVMHLDMVMMVFCVKGSMQGDVNGKAYTVVPGDVLICLPNTYLANGVRSEDFDAKIVGLSYPGIKFQMQGRKEIWDILSYLRDNPLLHLDDQQRQLFIQYAHILEMKLASPAGKFRKELVQSMFQTLLWELATLIEPLADKTYDGSSRQGGILFKRFLSMVTENGGRERSVRFYADKMCITPKYLSAVAKSVSGKTALEWIHRCTADAIALQLRYSERSIKEIANDFNFPNLSFFGKFVKANLGTSPKEYRRRLGENVK